MSKPDYKKIPYPKNRRATIGVLKAAKRKNMIHSLIEVDISEVRENIKLARNKHKRYISLTGYIIYCIAKSVEKDKIMHAYRNRKNQLVLFEDVDISTTIERKINNNSEVVAVIIRNANNKTAAEISEEIKIEKEKDINESEVYKSINLFLAIPSFIRQLVFKTLDKSPKLMKKRAGTVMTTSANMVGKGAGWGIPIATHTLNITIGSIVERLIQIDKIEKRQYLCLTLSFDHDIIDGAPAARFVKTLKAFIEKGKIIL